MPRRVLPLLVAALAAPVLPVAGGHAVPAAAVGSATAQQCPAPHPAVLRSTPATRSRTVALTFDDGPSVDTPAVLDALRASGARATFFVTGRNVRAFPDTARRIVAEGHVIANHTWSHPQRSSTVGPRGPFDLLPRATQADQLDRTTAIIREVTGVQPCFFRGPGGAHFAPTTLRLARARGMSVVHWTHGTYDYGGPARLSRRFQEKIVDKATRPSAPHAVVLLHDGKASPEPESTYTAFRGNTAAAVGRIVRFYRSRGFVFTDPAGAVLR